MSIDLSALYSVSTGQTQNYSNKATASGTTYTTSFADYLLQSSQTTSKSTIGDDLTSALSLNINDTAGLQSTFESYLGNSSSTTDLSSIYEQLLNPTDSSSSLYGSSDTSSSDTFSSALQSNFLASQMSMLSAAQANLTKNLEDYQTRNANDNSDAVKQRIAEMTNNITQVSTYLQDKLSEQQTTNQSLMDQLQSNSLYTQNSLNSK